MRVTLFAALLSLAAGANAAGDDSPGIPAQGAGSVRTYQASGFTAVSLAGGDDVHVRVGGGFAVRAEGDPAVLDRLKITREGDTLVVSRRRGGSWGKARVLVTMPAIIATSIGGSGNLRVDRVRGTRFAARVAGSGNLTVADLAVQDADVAISGSGSVAAGGAAQQLAVQISGSGHLDAPRLVARAADVRVAGSGGVRATVNGTADVRIAGSGDVDLGDGARCTVRKAGSGSVRCGG